MKFSIDAVGIVKSFLFCDIYICKLRIHSQLNYNFVRPVNLGG